MIATLPGTAKYDRAIYAHQRCSTVSCSETSRYGTATGIAFCGRCWRRLLAFRVAERETGKVTCDLAERKVIMAGWIAVVTEASEEEIGEMLLVMGDVLVSQVDDIDRRSVSEIVESMKKARG